MTDPFIIAALIGCTVLALGLGWLIGRQLSRSEISKLHVDNAKLSTMLETERRTATEKLDAIGQMRDELTKTFATLSNQALKDHSERFLELAREKLRSYESDGADFADKPVDKLLQPVKEALEKTTAQIEALDRDREETFGALPKHLELITHSQQVLHHEASALVDAMQNPGKRVEWSHLMLQRLADLAEVKDYCDIPNEEPKEGEQPGPDMTVNIPGDRQLVVVATTPLDAYISTVQAPDEAVRSWQLERHARALHDRIRELSGRAYWSRFENSPEFIVLLIPDEQYLSLALKSDSQLLDYALEKKVILATPTNLVSLLRVVAYGWRQNTLAENTSQFKALGEAVYKRLSIITQHLSTLSSNLNRSIESHYTEQTADTGDADDRNIAKVGGQKRRKAALAD